MKFLQNFTNWGIKSITGLIALALAAIAALWTQSDYEQYSAMAHMTAYVLLWGLWFLTAIKLVLTTNWRSSNDAIDSK